VIKITK